MRVPRSLVPLMEQGVIQEVVRPLMSGKEAQIYLVIADDEARVAKVYKEAENRSFRQRADYTEGRKVRSSRDQRAMNRGSRYGRSMVEETWRSAEVDAIYKLRAAGVRVPTPYDFIDGVFVMELITDGYGEPAPRLVDLDLDPRFALQLHDHLMQEIVKMLCAGVIHGDLSDFNVLMGADGPVIIDFPQAVDPAWSRGARRLLMRDADNLTSFLARFAPPLRGRRYGAELWDLYERGELRPDSRLTGRFRTPERRVDVRGVLGEIEDVARDAARRAGPPAPAPQGAAAGAEQAGEEGGAASRRRRRRRRRGGGGQATGTG